MRRMILFTLKVIFSIFALLICIGVPTQVHAQYRESKNFTFPLLPAI